jgi:hypothetical protein
MVLLILCISDLISIHPQSDITVVMDGRRLDGFAAMARILFPIFPLSRWFLALLRPWVSLADFIVGVGGSLGEMLFRRA